MGPVVIVATGVANTASVRAAFARLGVACELSADAEQIARAKAVVLPGVGSFASGMAALGQGGIREAIVERLERGTATLAICLGMQLLFEASEESPGVLGLGVAKGTVRRFDGALRVPQMGWNSVRADDACRVLQSGSAYYANSFRVAVAPEGWNAAISEYGGGFIGAIERAGSPAVVACQFHPELSGAFGAALLNRWLVAAREVVPC